METRMLIAIIAALAGFACLFAATRKAAESIRGRTSALSARGEGQGLAALVSWRLSNGYALTLPLARLMAGKGKGGVLRDALAECAARGIPATPESLVSVDIALSAVLATATALATSSIVGGLAVAACANAVVAVAAGAARDKRNERVRDAVPDALASMSACFGAGFTLLQTFRQVSSEVPGPLGETFLRSTHIMEMGGSASSALEELRTGAHASELAFVAVALDVQHQSGGAMRQVLDAAADTVKGELALRRSLQVQTAQAKLSARIVVVMPFVLMAAFSLASPDFLSPFFSSPFGYALLAAALVMQVAGIVLVRRALSVEGVA